MDTPFHVNAVDVRIGLTWINGGSKVRTKDKRQRGATLAAIIESRRAISFLKIEETNFFCQKCFSLPSCIFFPIVQWATHAYLSILSQHYWFCAYVWELCHPRLANGPYLKKKSEKDRQRMKSPATKQQGRVKLLHNRRSTLWKVSKPQCANMLSTLAYHRGPKLCVGFSYAFPLDGLDILTSTDLEDQNW